MTFEQCEHTETILAAGGGALAPDLERHLRACPACSDALLVESFLAREASALPVSAPVPDAGVVWRRAQARLAAEAVERATRPIVIFRRVAWVCGGVAGGGALLRLQGVVGEAAARVGDAVAGLPWGGPAGAGGGGAAWVAGALALATLFFGLYTTWAEEP